MKVNKELVARCLRGDRTAPLGAGTTEEREALAGLLRGKPLPAEAEVVEWDTGEEMYNLFGGLHGDRWD